MKRLPVPLLTFAAIFGSASARTSTGTGTPARKGKAEANRSHIPRSYDLRRSTALAVVLAMMTVTVTAVASPAQAAPMFKAPWTCGVTWHTSTYLDPSHVSDGEGVDFNDLADNSDAGAPVLASASGTATVLYSNGYGNYVDISHGDGWVTRYAHLATAYSITDRDSSTPGIQVNQGDRIGTVGTTGESEGEHLHYEQLQNGEGQPVTFDGVEIDVRAVPTVNHPYIWTPDHPSHQSTNNCTVTPISGVSTALIVDSSGSMTSNDPDNRRILGSRAYVSASLPADEVGIVDFDASVTILSEAVEVGPNRQTLYDQISLINSSGGTNLGAGLQAGCEVLERANGATRAAIFFTDGSGSYSGQSQCFADRGWKVYVFGLGSSVNSSLLQQIANDTGGDYKSLSEATNLICEFQQVRAKIGGGTTQPCEATGTILQGEVINLQPTILGPQLQQATFTNIWQGSDIEMTLTTPSGRTIDRNSTESDLVIDVGASYETFTISNPEAGSWGVSLFGADIPDGGEPYSFSTLAIESDVIDSDGDGVPDDEDRFPNSDMRDVVFVRDTETKVANLVLDDGATFNDLIDEASSEARNHGAFVSSVANFTQEWAELGLITGREAGTIRSTAGRAR